MAPVLLVTVVTGHVVVVNVTTQPVLMTHVTLGYHARTSQAEASGVAHAQMGW